MTLDLVQSLLFKLLAKNSNSHTVPPKEIKIILRLFLVIAMYCQDSSSQIKSITQPLPLLAGWEGSPGTRYMQ